jgi:hypothetical protein
MESKDSGCRSWARTLDLDLNSDLTRHGGRGLAFSQLRNQPLGGAFQSFDALIEPHGAID